MWNSSWMQPLTPDKRFEGLFSEHNAQSDECASPIRITSSRPHDKPFTSLSARGASDNSYNGPWKRLGGGTIVNTKDQDPRSPRMHTNAASHDDTDTDGKRSFRGTARKSGGTGGNPTGYSGSGDKQISVARFKKFLARVCFMQLRFANSSLI